MKIGYKGLAGGGLLLLLLAGCQNKEEDFDASGVFEAEEIMVPSQASGIVTQLDVEEGQQLQAGAILGYIDSTQLYLKKQQLLAQLNGLDGRIPQIDIQTAAFKKQMAVTGTQINTLEIEKRRVENLLKVDAATPKQLDDIMGQLAVLNKQLEVIDQQDRAQKSVLGTQSKGVRSEKSPLLVQIQQVDDQLSKCVIRSPATGTLLAKYIYTNEMAQPGKVLFKMADLSTIILRSYITGDQLSAVKLGQKVQVWTDATRDTYEQQEGVITWISSKAEFTPKTIQTKDERANMVYAMKVLVRNDGRLKIGMYGEVKFE